MRYCEQCRAAFRGMRTCPKCRIELRDGIEDPLIGHVLGDRYRVLEPIAAGGMGQVYRAAHTRIASLFAVKVLYGDLAYDDQMRTRFQREAEAASCLQSRHIVRVVDFSESSEGLLYLAMEHLAGKPFSTVLEEEKIIAPARAVALAIQIARGLGHAHERGIVHRDLKPGNVMIIREDDEPDVVRLLDFGIARLSSGNALTQAGAVMGTPEYMSPEQFRGSAKVDGRGDLYALGIMMYEMLTGDLPFYEEDIVQFAHKHFYAEPPPFPAPKAGREAPSPELERVVMRLLGKKPEDRYASGREVIAALKALPTKVSAEGGPRSVGPASLSVVPEPIAGGPAAERIQGAIGVGSPIYNAGDHAGCANVYRQTTVALLQSGLREDTRLAATSRLEVAVRRADASRDATRAAWELRWGFDDVLLVLRAQPSRAGDELALELAAAATIAAPRYAAQELDLVAMYFEAFAARVVAKARAAGDARAQPLEIALAASAGKGAQAVLASVGPALDQLRAGAPLSATGSYRRGGCGAEARYAKRISAAIGVGAPAYNVGDHDACYRAYRDCAQAIVADIPLAPERAPKRGETGAAPCAACEELGALLQTAIEKSGAVGASQAAWTLRHTFDQILG